ncbi:MAG: hypothetical protein ABI678_14050, partial [Kofleriaceae bacterium]
VVSPSPQLAVLATYLPGTPARLAVNPVLLAALEPGGDPVAPPVVISADSLGNPYSFYDSIGECANAQETRCEACMPTHTCEPTKGTGDGNAECKALAADEGRGYWLVCIETALEIDSVKTCTQETAPSCPIDNTGDFIDRPECASALDNCLGDHGGSTPPPETPSGCSDATCEATSCEDSNCDSGDCSDSSGGGGGDCSSDSSDSSGCDDSGGDGCSGGDSGGDCSGGGGDDCSSSGGDCAGDSGGDCGGGGSSDCNAGGAHHDHGYLWAFLPLPFAIIARRRADRRRAS